MSGLSSQQSGNGYPARGGVLGQVGLRATASPLEAQFTAECEGSEKAGRK